MASAKYCFFECVRWDSEAGDIVRTNNFNHWARHCRIKSVRIKSEPMLVWILA